MYVYLQINLHKFTRHKTWKRPEKDTETSNQVGVNIIYRDKVKVKVTLKQATKAQRGSRGIAVHFL